MNTSEKMYQIAKSLNELNPKGEVKAFTGNEKGYAKIIEIKRGLSILVYFSPKSLEDKLLITLDFTETAAKNDSTSVEKAIERFKKLFEDREIIDYQLQLVGSDQRRTRYYFEITDEPLEIISQILYKIKVTFGNDPSQQTITGFKKTPTIFYLPTKEDFANARRKCLREGKIQISIDEILDIMEVNLVEAGKNLPQDWRSLTKTKILSWSEKP